MFHQIFSSRLQNFRIVFQVSNAMVTSSAKQSSDLSGFVIMVNSGCQLHPSTRLHWLLTDCTFTILIFPHLVEDGRRDLVVFVQVPHPCLELNILAFFVVGVIFTLVAGNMICISFTPLFLVCTNMIFIFLAPTLVASLGSFSPCFCLLIHD